MRLVAWPCVPMQRLIEEFRGPAGRDGPRSVGDAGAGLLRATDGLPGRVRPGTEGAVFRVLLGGEDEEYFWPEAARLRELALRCRGFWRSRNNGMRCATSFLTCARCTANTIPANGSWRGRFWSGLSGARWESSRKRRADRGDSACISGAGGGLCHDGPAGDCADGVADAHGSELDGRGGQACSRRMPLSIWGTRFWRRRRAAM